MTEFSRAYRGKWMPAMIYARQFVDKSTFDAVIAEEEAQRELMEEFASAWPEFARSRC